MKTLLFSLLRTRNARLLGSVLGAVLASVSAASAGPLASALLEVDFSGLPTFAFPGAGATGTATSQLSASLGGSDVFDGAITIPSPTTAAPPITYYQVVITKNASGTFTGTAPGSVGGNLSIQGAVNLYGISGFPGSKTPLLPIPLNLGTPSTSFNGGGGVSITAIGAAWTVGTAAVTGLGGTDLTATAMGANGLTPGGQGTLVLVSPVKVLTNISGAFAIFGTLTLTYVPEPNTLLLVALGIAALAAAAPRLR
jgi:hypothetical protein